MLSLLSNLLESVTTNTQNIERDAQKIEVIVACVVTTDIQDYFGLPYKILFFQKQNEAQQEEDHKHSAMSE